MIVETIAQFGPWAWFIGGLVLLGLEIVVPGNVFVWFGIAAILTGVLSLIGRFGVHDVGWQGELIAFGVLSLILVVAGRNYFARRNADTDEPFLNRRADRLVGRRYVLGEPIVDGRGRIRVDDASWRVTGPDLPTGTAVQVVGHDGAVLSVDKVE